MLPLWKIRIQHGNTNAWLVDQASFLCMGCLSLSQNKAPKVCAVFLVLFPPYLQFAGSMSADLGLLMLL